MERDGRRFNAFLAAGLGAAASIVVALIAAQLSFIGSHHNPLHDLGDPDVRFAIGLSLGCATAAATLATIVAIPAAYALARWRFRGARLIDALLDVPMILSPIVVGISLVLLFRSTAGQWVEQHLMRFIFEVPGIILAQFVLALALEIRVLKASFEDVDPRLEQVARFLGCSPWSAFRRVSLPLARQGVLAGFVLGWSRALGDFGATVTIAGAVRGKTETIPISIYLNLASVRIGKAVVLSLVLVAIALLVLGSVRVLTDRRPA